MKSIVSLPLMATLEGWIPATPASPSFHDLFKIEVLKPRDQTRSRSTKPTSEAEEFASGPALHRLTTLNLEDLSLALPEHNFTWAKGVLAEYAPLEPQSWTTRTVGSTLTGFIRSEQDSLNFIQGIYLNRALCAGWFLYRHSATLDPSPCPQHFVLFWDDTSSRSASGRADRTLMFGDRRVVLCEGKTDRVSRWEDINVLPKLHTFATNFNAGPHVENWLRREGTWEPKGRKFLLQVCNNILLKNK